MTLTFLLRFVVAAALSLVIAALIASRPAASATLLADVTVEGDLVTLGDLFDGAGDLAGRPVFRSPDPGVDGALPAAQAIAAAMAAGLAVDPTPVTSVRVVRRSVVLGADAFRAMLAEAAARETGAPVEEIEITLAGDVRDVAADGAVRDPARVENFTVQAANGRFRAVVAVDVGAEMRTLEFVGTVVRTAEVVVPLRQIARGEIVGPADVALARRDRRSLDPTALDALDAVVGMAARRPLRAGDPVAAAALEPPRVVRRGEPVTIVYSAPGLTLTARGRALADAAMGEPVSVLNEQSRRTVEGVADGPDRVRVAPPAVRTAAYAAAQSIE